ncbi:hypothetical protein [Gimesia panareensis]|uniref:Uncharacterized protein n=1 Tax=Gimesia panareensis TaxID=2527978 RepID=A0A517Q165_9PLAN|nr:hypothetical protein [Gimesia panareensis]QDT25369.1 hypothetical protein Enr10x_06640 [Gimesia panareensis]QDU48329.1 hypothetical protein Pan110_06420 [Gimesia panareensis]QDV18575.1 hypothetical protein Pan153_32340 [Gimesia panareensis]
MKRFLKKKIVITVIFCLTAGWMVLALNAEVEQNARRFDSDRAVEINEVAEASDDALLSNVAEFQTELPATTTVKQTFYPVLTAAEQQIQEMLQTRVDVDFQKVSLAEALDTLQKQHQLNLVLSPQQQYDLEQAEEWTISVSVKGITLGSALEQVLKPYDLTYTVDQDMLKIMSNYEASQIFKVRLYPVTDLCRSHEDYEQLREVIRNARLGNWKPDGLDKLDPPIIGFGGGHVSAEGYQFSGGTISILPQTGSLVISQNYHTHQKVVDFLNLLRQVKQEASLKQK